MGLLFVFWWVKKLTKQKPCKIFYILVWVSFLSIYLRRSDERYASDVIVPEALAQDGRI